MFELRVPIRYRDSDALGHVNYAVYLTYIEELLLQWLGPVLGDDFVMAHLELDYRSELRHTDGHAVVRATLERVGTSSITAGIAIHGAGPDVALDARVVMVAWDPVARASRQLTDGERDAVTQRAQ